MGRAAHRCQVWSCPSLLTQDWLFAKLLLLLLFLLSPPTPSVLTRAVIIFKRRLLLLGPHHLKALEQPTSPSSLETYGPCGKSKDRKTSWLKIQIKLTNIRVIEKADSFQLQNAQVNQKKSRWQSNYRLFRRKTVKRPRQPGLTWVWIAFVFVTGALKWWNSGHRWSAAQPSF